MTFIKKFLKFVFTLLIIALLAGSGYVLYDYYQHPVKYDTFAQLFKDKVTGRDQITIEEVSPFVTPEMTLTLENSAFTGMTFEPHADFEPTKPVIMCYGKDMGGNLYVPIPDYCQDFQALKLYGGPGRSVQNIEEYVSFDVGYRQLEVSEELLMSLEAGDYYIISDCTPNGATEAHKVATALILEEETTFNSTERGFVTYGDEFAWIVNDLEKPRDIDFVFYNLGDNPIRTLLYDSDSGGAYLIKDVEPENYVINERGNVVTLKAEYLARLPVNTTKKFAVRLANGDQLDMGWTVVGTVRGDSLHRMTMSGPDTYSLSRGGDFVVTYEPNDCESIHTFFMDYFPSDRVGGELIKEVLRGEDTGEYLDMATQTITIPEEFMKTLTPDDGSYDMKIGYWIGEVWFDAFHPFAVTE